MPFMKIESVRLQLLHDSYCFILYRTEFFFFSFVECNMMQNRVLFTDRTHSIKIALATLTVLIFTNPARRRREL